MKELRLHIARFVTLLVALQILNMGFFVQDFKYNVPSSSSIYDENIINSVVEYVTEVVLDNQNAMPESNERHSNKDMQVHKHFTVKMVEIQTPSFAVNLPNYTSQVKTPPKENYYCQFCKEINPPPPKA